MNEERAENGITELIKNQINNIDCLIKVKELKAIEDKLQKLD